MKNLLNQLLLIAAFFCLILSSCQKEDSVIKDTNNNPIFSLASDCNSDCLEEGDESAPTTFTLEYQTGLWVSVDVTNTLTHVNYTFNSNTSIKNIVFDGTSLFCFTGTNHATLPFVHSVAIANLVACELATADITVRRASCSANGAGSKVVFNTSHSLIGKCEVECEDELIIEEINSNTFKFTYYSSTDLTNADIRFTCPHIIGWESDPVLSRVNPGGGPTVLKWEGDLTKCEPMIWTITFDPDCDQNNAGFANLWTDFKVNGESKKGTNNNIVFDCN